MATVQSCVTYCRDALVEGGAHFGHGTGNATDEAAWLVLHVVGAPLDGTFDDWRREVTKDDCARISELLGRRICERLPLAYLLGEAWFCGLRFEVTPDVLVPRSPLAEVIMRRYRPWVVAERVNCVLDLCTGSGCIAVATAVRLPHARVVACDIDAAALAVAERNASHHGVADRVECVRSDLFDTLGGRRFDLIVSNPPYVPGPAGSRLPPEYRAEPGIALFSGVDGLDVPLRILHRSADYLEAGGVLICEVGESAGRLQDLLPEVPFTWLEFEHGGEGAFTMERGALIESRSCIERAMEHRQHVV